MNSTNLTQEMGLTQLSLGGWNLNCHSTVISIEKNEQAALEAYAKNWSQIFPRDRETLAFKLFDIPSILIRFDYSISETGKVMVYEIDDRPMGIAHGMMANPSLGFKMQKIFDSLRKAIDKKISVFVSPSRHENSDDLLLKSFDSQIFNEYFSSLESIHPEHALFVRSLRDEKEFWPLEKMSLSTISKEGWKGYGCKMNLWQEILEAPDFNVPFVVKPEYGCRGENVYLFHPNKKAMDGFSTKTKILHAIEEKLVQYIQPYHQPETPSFLDEKYNLIRRVYLGFNPGAMKYECLGGMWMARKSVKIHGASDTISGAIVAI